MKNTFRREMACIISLPLIGFRWPKVAQAIEAHPRCEFALHCSRILIAFDRLLNLKYHSLLQVLPINVESIQLRTSFENAA
ncbi:hypothetical protein HDV62DRAFT_357068 [Trichoderma sp. SZMC 28011]